MPLIATNGNIELLQIYAQTYGIEVSDTKAHMMLRHLDLLVAANRRVNLTRITEPQDALVRHVLDSLLMLPSLRNHPCGLESYLDMGTGGGFPGIPLGVMTGHRGTLIDSVGKKITAVNTFIEALDLKGQIKAQALRAEDLARQTPQSYGYVVARAVAQLGALVEYAAPLLVMNGYLIVSKANISDEELTVGVKTGALVGLRMVSRETFELPNDMGHREIITYEKHRPSSIRLPRQNGAAVHKPLV